MRRYQVHEYFTRGIFAYRPVNRMIQSKFAKKNRRGGIIVFPDGVEEKDIDTSFINGRFRIDYLLPGRYATKDGTCFSEYSPCLDIRDYRSGDLMTVARKYMKSFPGKTFLLKDIDDGRLYNVRYVPKEAAKQNPVVRIDEVLTGRYELNAA